MLRAYCLEVGGDWEEAVPWLLFASREVVQESLGFSPAELLFSHNVRTPLAVLKEQWLSAPSSRSVVKFVNDFRSRLHRARELARQNLQEAQSKMKNLVRPKSTVSFLRVS